MILESKQAANRRRVREHIERDPAAYREKCRLHEQARLANDPGFRAQKRARQIIWSALRQCKSRHWLTTCGYSTRDLREHLERQFAPGMGWSNYGTYWNVDHIKPVSSFTNRGIYDPAVINALDNLRPLLKQENASKHSKDAPTVETYAGKCGHINGKHHLSKLTREQVVDIKQSLLAGVSCGSIAKELHVARNTIQQIKDGRSWRDV